MKYALNALKNRATFATAMALLVSSSAHAQIANTNMKVIFTEPKFQTAVTLGFGIFAFYKWVEYFAGFSPSNALSNIILPGVLTFLTFQWDKVIKWFGLV